ncbi:hypothetical protein [Methylobacterium sp. 77]|uniref:hypothetical protein n=1 Tax=Methylobacterium sp. 77 TaxID=1101192 RepID=UPI0003617246|nr:hypothetical protein [Methylobacterium sp. 77]
MTVRSALTIAAIAAAIAALGTPASAQDVRTLAIWNHTFDVMEWRPASVAAFPASDSAIRTTGSIAPKRAYASAKAGVADAGAVEVQPTRTLDVWDAAVSAPVR